MFVTLSMRAGAAAGLALLAMAGGAHAQSMSTNSASFNGGYGRANGQENQGIQNYSNRDASGNMLIVDGIIQAGGSSYSRADASASASASGSFSGGVGVGSSSATAIGNNLNVVTQGNFNTVIVNSTQINTGAVTAGAKTTGGVGNGQ